LACDQRDEQAVEFIGAVGAQERGGEARLDRQVGPFDQAA